MNKLPQNVKRVRIVATLEPEAGGRVAGEIEIDLSSELGGKPLETVIRLGERLAALGGKELERALGEATPKAPPGPRPTTPARKVEKLEAELEPIGGGKAIRLGPEVVIGRSKVCDVPVPSPKVSRQHARLMAAGDAHVLEDLASANHTFRNGERVADPVTLADGDHIQIGDVVFRYRVLGRARAPSPRLAG